MDNIDLAAARTRGIVLGWTLGANSNAVAELTLGLIFTLARRIPQADRALREGHFVRMSGVEVRDRTLGIIGLGRIGRQVASMANCLGMQVFAHDPFLKTSPLEAVRLVELDQLLHEADFVSLHLTLKEDTRHLIDQEMLSLMKPGALLVNTARGEIVDEDALYKAIQSGKLGGAAVDCFSQEPACDSPLLQLEQVIGTPHIASHTQEASRMMSRMAAENVIAGLQGKPLPYPYRD